MSFLSSFLEKLKKVHIHLNINLPITINITKDSNNTQIVNGVYYDKDKNILNLNPDTLSSNIKQDLPLIVKDYINNGNKLLENKSSNLLERLY